MLSETEKETYAHVKHIGSKCGSDYIIDENCNQDWHLKDLKIAPNSLEEKAFKDGWNEAVASYNK